MFFPRNSSPEEQSCLLELLWTLWADLPLYGRKASQFVDLLGYFLLTTPHTSDKKVRIDRSTTRTHQQEGSN